MPIHKVHSGSFRCPSCGDQYVAESAADDELVCPECEVELEEAQLEEESSGAEKPVVGTKRPTPNVRGARRADEEEDGESGQRRRGSRYNVPGGMGQYCYSKSERIRLA